MEKIPKEIAYKQEVDKKKGYDLGVKMGYKEGLVMGELKTIVRVKKGVKRYIKKHKELKENEGDLLNIILGVKL